MTCACHALRVLCPQALMSGDAKNALEALMPQPFSLMHRTLASSVPPHAPPPYGEYPAPTAAAACLPACPPLNLSHAAAAVTKVAAAAAMPHIQPIQQAPLHVPTSSPADSECALSPAHHLPPTANHPVMRMYCRLPRGRVHPAGGGWAPGPRDQALCHARAAQAARRGARCVPHRHL